MLRHALVIALAALILKTAAGQEATVTTVEFSTNLSLDGIVVAPNGTVYGAQGFNGFRIYEIDLSGTSKQVVTSLNGPIDMDFDSTGTLYVTTFNDRGLFNANPVDGSFASVATVNTGPSGIAIDRNRGIVYVSHYGSGAFGNGQTILAVDLATGQKSNFAVGNGLNAPVSLAVDEVGNVYAANITDAKIFRITPAGELTHIATLPVANQAFNVGHVAWARGGLYVTGNGGKPYVYRVEPSGEFEIIAGNGQVGSTDGPALSATFNAPNGIAATNSEDSLLVSELNNPRAIRVIELPARTTSVEDGSNNLNGFELGQSFPNPVVADRDKVVRFTYRIPQPTDVTIRVHDVLGRSRSEESQGLRRAGTHDAEIDVTGLSTGLYHYVLETETGSLTRRMVVVK